jgi:hypothetical protein
LLCAAVRLRASVGSPLLLPLPVLRVSSGMRACRARALPALRARGREEPDSSRRKMSLHRSRGKGVRTRRLL